MRGAGLVGASCEIVVWGVPSELLLLEELDWARRARGVSRSKDARHAERTAGW
jgi:hypothetical protein